MKNSSIKVIFLALSLLAGLSTGCREPSESIDLTQHTETYINDIFSDIKIVQLAQTSELIGRIRKVVYYSSHFYILDDKSQIIFRFDENGHFVSKISARGRGPGEYNFITDFTIDTINSRLVLLDPAVARVHYFSLDGAHIETIPVVTEKVMGLNKVFVLNDTTLLVSSITNEQVLIVNSRTGSVLHKKFLCPAAESHHLQAFSPDGNIYQLGGETFVMQALSRDVFNITNVNPDLHFSYCFGNHNNSDQQISDLVAEIKAGRRFGFPHEGVGKGKLLNHHFYSVFETKRFHYALLEFDNNFTHVFIDKQTGKQRVFRAFSEGIQLFFFSLHTEYAIGFEVGFNEAFDKIPELAHRDLQLYNPSLLSEAERQIIANHDPMTQNPFLVVYRFRE